MKTLVILLAACAFAASMVPLEKRAVESDEDTRPTTSKPLCARQTPCAWSVYNAASRIIAETINNTYCTCAPDMICDINEDDSAANAYIYRCRSNKGDVES